MPYDGDPDHPIVERPCEYEIVGFGYHRDPDSWADSYIDLTLQKGSLRRRLPFRGPQDLEITRGFPSSMGLCILDVSGRQLEGIRVRVDNFEGSGGCPTFWAREVVDLDASDRVRQVDPADPTAAGRSTPASDDEGSHGNEHALPRLP